MRRTIYLEDDDYSSKKRPREFFLQEPDHERKRFRSDFGQGYVDHTFIQPSISTPQPIPPEYSRVIRHPTRRKARKALSVIDPDSERDFMLEIPPLPPSPSLEEFLPQDEDLRPLVEDIPPPHEDNPPPVEEPPPLPEESHALPPILTQNIIVDRFQTSLFRRYGELSYIDIHNTNQHYAPGTYKDSVVRSLVSGIVPGYSVATRTRDRVNLRHLSVNLHCILPEKKVTEMEAGTLNDEIRVIIGVDHVPPLPGVDLQISDVLLVHDPHKTINAFINPSNASRFTFLYDQTHFMAYSTVWEFTRAEAEKEAKALLVDFKQTIDIPLKGIQTHFNPLVSGIHSVIKDNIFMIFISAKGINSSTLEHVSDVKELKTFEIEWSSRIIFE